MHCTELLRSWVEPRPQMEGVGGWVGKLVAAMHASVGLRLPRPCTDGL